MKPTIIFALPDLKYLNYHKAFAGRDPQDFSLCLARERYAEFAYCALARIPFTVITDRDRPVTIPYKAPFLRGDIDSLNKLRSQLTEPRVLKSEIDAIRKWPNIVSTDFTKRIVAVVRHSQFDCDENGINKDALKPFIRDDKFFFKSVKKDINGIYDFNNPQEHAMTFLKDHGNMILSQPIDIATDDNPEHNKREWRVWVINHQFAGASRYVDYQKPSCPDFVTQFANQFIEAHQSILPCDYALDIAETTDRGCCVIELNPIESSGRYVIPFHLALQKLGYPPDDDAWEIAMLALKSRDDKIIQASRQTSDATPKTPNIDALNNLLDQVTNQNNSIF